MNTMKIKFSKIQWTKWWWLISIPLNNHQRREQSIMKILQCPLHRTTVHHTKYYRINCNNIDKECQDYLMINNNKALLRMSMIYLSVLMIWGLSATWASKNLTKSLQEESSKLTSKMHSLVMQSIQDVFNRAMIYQI